MKKQFSILRGAFRSNFRSVAWNLLLAVPLRAARLAAATNAHGPKELRWVSFALLALLALAPLSQAQTNRPSGAVVVWGDGGYGQANVPLAAKSGVVAIAPMAPESGHVMALKSDGSVVAWGANAYGQTDVPSEAQSGVVAIAAGGSYDGGHSVALKSDGSVVAWGRNEIGPPADVYGVTDVPSEAQSGVVAIAAGNLHTVALKSDGSVVAWGDNLYGQVTGIPVTALPRCAVAAPVTLGGQVLSGVTAIAAGELHTVALKNDGSVVVWGSNLQGERNVPVAAKSGVVTIAGGTCHTVALKSDGSVVAWGWNEYGQTDVPVAAKSGVVAIAAGHHKTLALKNDGSILAWGWPYPEVPADLPPALAIDAGNGWMVALVREPAPSLTILRNADQTVSLSWTGAGTLEQTESLTPSDWQPAPSQANPQTNSTTNLMKFFRVKAD